MHCSASSFFLSSLHALGRRDGDDDERVADDAGEEDDEDERDQHHLVRVDAHPAAKERRTITLNSADSEQSRSPSPYLRYSWYSSSSKQRSLLQLEQFLIQVLQMIVWRLS